MLYEKKGGGNLKYFVLNELVLKFRWYFRDDIRNVKWIIAMSYFFICKDDFFLRFGNSNRKRGDCGGGDWFVENWSLGCLS